MTDQTHAGADGGDGASPTDAGGDDGTGGKEKTLKKVNYKKKFAGSSKENQRLVGVNADLQSQVTTGQSRHDEIALENKELRTRLEKDNPDSFNDFESKKVIEQQTKDIASMKETQDLDSFLSSNKEAKPYKEALRSLKKANPSKSYKQLLSENFSTALKVTKKAKIKKRAKEAKRNAPERGGDTADPSTTSVPADFDSWPPAKRKAWFKKNGIK